MARRCFSAHWLGLLGFCVLIVGQAPAQVAPDSARLALKVGIVRLLASTYEAEIEYRCARRLSLTLAPRVLAGPVPKSVSETAHDADDRVHGYGLSLSPRFYIPNTSTEGAMLAGLYVGLKADYQHLRLTYQQEAWAEERGPDGLLYYTYRPRDYHETIRRYGGAATLGY